MNKLISAIESSLIKEGVVPGQQAKDTHNIQASKYISYKNDRDIDGKYPSKGFNPSNEPDELQHIVVSTATYTNDC